MLIDRDALVQVIQNLVSNVIKYASGGKELDVSVKRKNQFIEIVFADRGPGVPARLSRKIFRKFYRVDNCLNAKTGGSGLGLAIARGLLQEQGGRLLYRSRDGGGAEFIIVIREAVNEEDN